MGAACTGHAVGWAALNSRSWLGGRLSSVGGQPGGWQTAGWTRLFFKREFLGVIL